MFTTYEKMQILQLSKSRQAVPRYKVISQELVSINIYKRTNVRTKYMEIYSYRTVTFSDALLFVMVSWEWLGPIHGQ